MSTDGTRKPGSQEIVAAFAERSAATVHEAMGKRGSMPTRIKPIYPGMKVCGRALTVACPPGDNLAVHFAITKAAPGDVLVVSTGSYYEAGPWGEILTVAAMTAGISGLVIDGTVRDGIAMNALGFPVFAAGLNMKGTQKMLPGRIGEPTVVAGVLVEPGDLVLGDDDGVVVVPWDEADAVLEAAVQRDAVEAEMLSQLRAGKTTVELLGLEGVLRNTGML